MTQTLKPNYAKLRNFKLDFAASKQVSEFVREHFWRKFS